MKEPLVVVLGDYADEEAVQALAEHKCRLISVTTDKMQTIPAMDPVALLVWHTVLLDGDFLEQFKSLKLVVRMGVGVDNIDIEAAGKLGIAVCNTAGYGTEEVADSTMTHILNLYRRTFHWVEWSHSNEKLRNARHTKETAGGITRIRGQKMGIIGLGCIGSAVSQRAKAFGFNVSFYDPYLHDDIEKDHGIRRHGALKDLLSESDIITLHCNLVEDNNHLLNADTIALMKPGSRIVNVARGGLIDEKALVAALKSGHISCAALDVHEVEPYVHDKSPFADCPNVYCTPHIAWFSDESLGDIWRMAVTATKCAITSGSEPKEVANCVNLHTLVPSAGRWH